MRVPACPSANDGSPLGNIGGVDAEFPEGRQYSMAVAPEKDAIMAQEAAQNCPERGESAYNKGADCWPVTS
jgi:hypothetical protein